MPVLGILGKSTHAREARGKRGRAGGGGGKERIPNRDAGKGGDARKVSGNAGAIQARENYAFRLIKTNP